MSTHLIRETLPEGFNYADRLQVESFMATASVDGASKVCLVAGAGGLPRLACRLRPPRLRGEWYITEYEAGWLYAKTSTTMPDGTSSAFDDGYLDQATGRMKWHKAHCADHNTSGCGVA